MKKIPIVMICDDNFVMQTSVALMSLYKNKLETTIYDIFIIMVEGNEEQKETIKKLHRNDFLINIIDADLERYVEIKQLAHVPLASCLKFEISDLIPQYDKLLYLDGDIIVRKDIVELYETDLGENYVAGIPHSLGIVSGEKKLNGGVLLFNAAKIRKEKMRKVFVETRQSLGDRKSMDQETFHIVFGNKKVFLEPKYNVMIDKVDYEKKYYTMKAYNDFFHSTYKSRKEIIDSAVIIHFTGSIKPWKYSFATCGAEWRRYYNLLFGDTVKLELKGKIEYYKEQIEQNGLKSIYWLMKDKLLGILGERFHLFPDKSYGQWN